MYQPNPPNRSLILIVALIAAFLIAGSLMALFYMVINHAA